MMRIATSLFIMLLACLHTGASATEPCFSHEIKARLAPSNSEVRWSGPVPEQLELKSMELKQLGAAEISRIKKGEQIQYLVDSDDHLWIAPSGTSLSSDTLLLVNNSSATESLPFLAKETGTITFDSKTKQISLRPSTSVGLSHEETSALTQDLKTIAPTDKVARNNKGISRAKLVHCMDVLNDQSGGKRFILGRLIADNAIATSTIITSELLGAGRLQTEHGREVIISDLIGTNMSSLVSGYVGKVLILGNVGMATNVGVRVASGMGLIAIQNGIYRELIRDNASEHANSISQFDTAYFLARIPINQMVDRAILEKVPALFFEACTKDSKARLLISPTAVRLYERYGSALIYYGLRKSIINE